jgi:rubrerythrin
LEKKMPEKDAFARGQIERRDFIINLLRISSGAGFLGILNACADFSRLSLIPPQEGYPSTISILQELCTDEFETRSTYLEYAKQANSEYYEGIALLFVALAASDSVHLKNFENCLLDLRIDVIKKRSLPEIQVLSTQGNLQRTVEMELEKVDRYSRYLEKVRTEKYKLAIERIWYALESEKKHREHLRRVQKYTGRRFKLLAYYMEKKPPRYYVCQTCGYTVIEPPEESCPICNRPVSHYQKVERVKLASQ